MFNRKLQNRQNFESRITKYFLKYIYKNQHYLRRLLNKLQNVQDNGKKRKELTHHFIGNWKLIILVINDLRILQTGIAIDQ